jgi:hypothetical protein
MKGTYALARALVRNAPQCRAQLIAAVARHLAAGDGEAALREGSVLDRAGYAEAHVQAARLRREPIDRAIARFVSRCFGLLHDLAARLRFVWAPRPSHNGATRQVKQGRPDGRRRAGGGTP